MKVFQTLTRRIVWLILILAAALSVNVYAGQNPSREEIEEMIEQVAIKRAVPPVLLKAIARVETSFRHFDDNGNVKINGNNIGLMMVNNSGGGYDTERLKNDIMYNIEAGADALMSKWSMSSTKSVASVGNMDPNVLENWYFALWAYNGWAQSNNPNMIPYYHSSYVKKYTFQQKIYDVCKEEYQQSINNIDFSYLPKSGKPSRSLVVPTPASVNYGDIVLYEPGDYVCTDTIRLAVYLRNTVSGKYIHELGNNTLCRITEGPVMKDGYYWYKVQVNDNISGWIERNWLKRTGDVVNGLYVYDDISYHWARKSIAMLYNSGKIDDYQSFSPDEATSKESFCVFLGKTVELEELEEAESVKEPVSEPMEFLLKEKIINKTGMEAKGEAIADLFVPITKSKSINEDEAKKPEQTKQSEQIHFADKDKISPWALEYVENAYEAGLLDYYSDNFKPRDSLTRKEAAVILSNVVVDGYESVNINAVFSDVDGLNNDEREAVKKVYLAGLMSGKSTAVFNPEGHLSRGESAAIMAKLMDSKQ